MACSGACYEMVDTMEYAPYSTGVNIVQLARSICLLPLLSVHAALLGYAQNQRRGRMTENKQELSSR